MVKIKAFLNGKVCLDGRCLEEAVYVDEGTGLIVLKPDEMPEDFVDLKGQTLCPAFIELQTNGALGFHFTQSEDKATYHANLHRVSRHYVTQGVGSFYVTLPTVHTFVLKKVQIIPLAWKEHYLYDRHHPTTLYVVVYMLLVSMIDRALYVLYTKARIDLETAPQKATDPFCRQMSSSFCGQYSKFLGQ